jgi:hypothetical protein
MGGRGLVAILVGACLIGACGKGDSLAAARKQDRQTESMLVFVGTAIERYLAQMGSLPPMATSEFARSRWDGLSVRANDTNACSECLLVALRHPDLSPPLSELPTPFGNTDEDMWTATPPGAASAAAAEILDGYGNPIVYITSDRYNERVRVTRADGQTVEVRAVRKQDGSFYNTRGYQLISLGRDGKQDQGERVDDFANFTREE